MMKKITAKTALENRLHDLKVAATDFRTLCWLWHLADEFPRKVDKKFVTKIHSAMGSVKEIYMHPDLRKKFIALVREADRRRRG